MLPLNGITTGTTNWLSFSEMTFHFAVTPELFAKGVLFAAVMGPGRRDPAGTER